MADYVEDEFCGVDGVKEDQDNALSATDDFGSRQGAKYPHNHGTDHQRGKVEYRYRSCIKRSDNGTNAKDEEDVEYAGSHNIA